MESLTLNIHVWKSEQHKRLTIQILAAAWTTFTLFLQGCGGNSELKETQLKREEEKTVIRSICTGNTWIMHTAVFSHCVCVCQKPDGNYVVYTLLL